MLHRSEIVQIARRLSSLETLNLPAHLTRDRGALSEEEKCDYVQSLLNRDVAVFLERHGPLLNPTELAYFETLRSNFEIDFYLRRLRHKIVTMSSTTGSPGISTQAKNRRLAQMEMLLSVGTHFSDEAMRDREPYLYHLYIGQYLPRNTYLHAEAAQQPTNGLSAAPVTVLASAILRQQDEVDLILRRDREREMYALQEEEEESESGSEEEDERRERGAIDQQHKENGVAGNTKHSHESYVGGAWNAAEEISEDQRTAYADAFLDLMKQKFLSGQDASVDYTVIDTDAALDDHFAVEASRDAEEAYFDAG